MSDQRRMFVITRQGEVGPFLLEDLPEAVQAGRIARSDRVRSAFGVNLGTVGEALAAGPRQQRTTSGRHPTSSESPSAPSPTPVRPPILTIGIGLTLVLVTGTVLLVGREQHPGMRARQGSDVPSVARVQAPAPSPLPPPTPPQSVPVPTVAASSNPVPRSTGIPFEHRAQIIPGTLKLWRFNDGGEGVGYHDTTPSNQGSFEARPGTGVDLQVFPKGKNPNLFWIRDGEWLHFTCHVAQAGRYRWRCLAARDPSRFSGSVGLEWRLDGRLVGTPGTVYDTGSFKEFRPFQGEVVLPAGSVVMRLGFAGDGLIIQDFTFSLMDPSGR